MKETWYTALALLTEAINAHEKNANLWFHTARLVEEYADVYNENVVLVYRLGKYHLVNNEKEN